MSNDENKFQPIFQILHIKSAWFLLELAMALVTTIGMRFLQVWIGSKVVTQNAIGAVTKGQLISKAIFVFLTSSKKRTKKIVLSEMPLGFQIRVG